MSYLKKNLKKIITYWNLLLLCMWLQGINKVNVTHQGQGNIKVKVNLLFERDFVI